jgi:transcription elongation factor GreA-like protein
MKFGILSTNSLFTSSLRRFEFPRDFARGEFVMSLTWGLHIILGFLGHSDITVTRGELMKCSSSPGMKD